MPSLSEAIRQLVEIGLKVNSKNWIGSANDVSDSILAKLVVTVIVLIGFSIWLASERHHSPGCQDNCPTDISASRK
jgi:hypothetical protein